MTDYFLGMDNKIVATDIKTARKKAYAKAKKGKGIKIGKRPDNWKSRAAGYFIGHVERYGNDIVYIRYGVTRVKNGEIIETDSVRWILNPDGSLGTKLGKW